MGAQLLAPVSCTLPAKFIAGLTLSKEVALAAYPAPAWSLTVYLRGPRSIDLVAAANGSAHILAAAAATTSAWHPGEYSYSARVTDGVNVHEVDAGRFEVLPDMAQVAAGHDGRSHNRITLDAIKAVIEKRATRDQERYVIEGQGGVRRELWRTPLADLLKLKATYVELVRSEDRKARGLPLFAQARVRF